MTAAASGPLTPSTTPPTSDLWATAGSSVFITTGYPRSQAAATASACEVAVRHALVGMP